MDGTGRRVGDQVDAYDGEAGLPAARALAILAVAGTCSLPAAVLLGFAQAELQDAAAGLAGLAAAVGIFKALEAISGMRAFLPGHPARLASTYVD